MGDLLERLRHRIHEVLPGHPSALSLYAGQVVMINSIEDAARAQTERLMVDDNLAVYALNGNAADPNVQDYVLKAKGKARGGDRPLAINMPFTDDILQTISLDRIVHRRLRKLLRDGEALTESIGGISFIRAWADMRIKKIEDYPNSVIPEPSQKEPQPSVQLYSPEGILTKTRITRAVLRLGGLPVITSVNVSGQPESTTEVEARAFINEERPDPIKLPLFVNKRDEDKPERPRGSYPALRVLPDRLQLFRPGWLAPDLMQDLFPDVPVELATGEDYVPVKDKYLNNVLRREDLPKDEQNLKGPELRLAILDKLV